MNWILDFNDPLATRAEITGGKGRNLSLLTSGGFPVPRGVIVNATAYRKWLEAAPWWSHLVRTLPVEDSSALSEAASELRELLAGVPLPDDVAAGVRSALMHFPEGTCFAVRSSSTMEDLAQAAFAGQHDTFLNCSGPESILAAVRNCYLSLWHDRAIAYRHHHGFDHQAANMAVVIQEMANCDAAGVAFSINPVTGNLTQAVIDANLGLGESVVSGECEVDHWEVEKATGRVVSRTIARKTLRTVCLAVGGTADEELDETDRDAAALSDVRIVAVTDLLCRVENWFRFPQDIEWGFAGNRLLLLQSRPVTTIPPRWTRDESAERFPNAITPLTWDFVDRGFRRSMDYSFRLMGFPPFFGTWFSKHDHYIYGEQNAVEIYARRFPFSLTSLADLPVLIPKLREEFRWVQELPVHWSRDLDYYLIRLGEFMAEPLDQKSLDELWSFVREVDEHGAQYFQPNIAISVTQGVIYRLLGFLLGELFGPHEVAPLMDGLLAFCETKTGTINKELYELAQMVRRDPGLEALLRAPEASRSLWESTVLEREHASFLESLRLFLRNHGHREIDFDPYHPLWAEVPWVVLDQVRLMLDAPDNLTPAQRERGLKVRAQEAEFSLFQKLPAELHFFMHETIRLARLYTGLDDLEHYQTTRLALPFRKGLLMLGQRLVERGVISEPSDTFVAREQEITDAIARENPRHWLEFAAAVLERKTSWELAAGQSPGWEPDECETKVSALETGAVMTGLPGSPGTMEGEVFVVTGPQDFASFPKGAVLVARTTNPAWTPLFYTAGAVITESGGPLSHGAVTAREMRIPAVMSVRSCLSQLTTGSRVRVDGGRGQVMLLEDQSLKDDQGL